MSPTGRKRCQRARQPDLFESCVSDVWNQTTSKETHWWHWCEQQSKSQQVAAMNESVILHHWNVAKNSSLPTHIRCIRTGDEWNKAYAGVSIQSTSARWAVYHQNSKWENIFWENPVHRLVDVEVALTLHVGFPLNLSPIIGMSMFDHLSVNITLNTP